MVIVLFLVGVALFLWVIVPVITDQVSKITDNAPGWLDGSSRTKGQSSTTGSTSSKVRGLRRRRQLHLRDVQRRPRAQVRMLGALVNAFVVMVLTLYS